MAARRLIIVLLVLMAISTVAAALAPPIEERRAETSTESTAEPAGGEGNTENSAAAGVLLEQRIDAGGPPQMIGAVVGDRLALTVTSPTPTNVQIPALGLTDFADRGAPAEFAIALREQARYRVLLDDGTTVATIQVAEAEVPPKG
jgi:hypothetical protein